MSDLIPSGNTGVSKYKTTDGAIMGLEDVGAGDFVMPRYRLVQNTSAEGEPGEYLSNVSGESFSTLAVTVLAVNKYKVMWPKDFKRGDTPLCRSFNGRTMVAGGVGDGDCARCQYASWANGKPACSEGYTFMVIDHNNVPAMISFRGSSIKPVKNFLTQIISRGLPPFAFKVNLKSKKERNDKGNYFVADFEIVGQHTDDDMDRYAETLRGLQAFMPKDNIIEENEAPSTTQFDGGRRTGDDDLPF